METNCANCLRHLGPTTLKANEIEVNISLQKTSYKNPEQIRNISVANALSCIFNFPLVDPNLNRQLFVCVSCCHKLKELLKPYKSFIHHQKQGSFLWEKIEEAKRRWTTTNQNNNSSNKSTISSPLKLLAVKTESNEIFGNDHGLFKYMENAVQQQQKNEDDTGLDIDCYSDVDHELDQPPPSPPTVPQPGPDPVVQISPHLSPVSFVVNPQTSNINNRFILITTNSTPNSSATSKTVVKAKKNIKPNLDQSTPSQSSSSSSSRSSQNNFNLQTQEECLKYKLNDPSPPFTCPTCALIIQTYDNYKKHVTYHLSENFFKCSKCDYGTSKFKLFETHCEQDHGFKPSSPSKSWPDFDLDQYLLPSEKSHKPKIYICPYLDCEQVFTGKQCKPNYVHHCEKIHNFKPQEASNILRIKIGNDVKIVKITGDPPYYCNQPDCTKSFGTTQTLASHLRALHFGRKEFTCSQCKKVMTMGAKTRHVKTCGKKKKVQRKKIYLPPFICNICSSAESTVEFPSRLRLMKHIHKVHEPPKGIWNCALCSKTFFDRNQLNSHMISHSQERKATCDECGRTYKTEANLRFHKKIAHDEEGRQQYNAYCRLKNRRRKTRLTMQNSNPVQEQVYEMNEDGTIAE